MEVSEDGWEDKIKAMNVKCLAQYLAQNGSVIVMCFVLSLQISTKLMYCYR